MANVQAFSFNAFQMKNIRIDQDNNGLFALVPDQSGSWKTVRCVESKTSVYASHCDCHTFAQKQHCNHVEIVKAYYGKLYKAPVVEEVAAVVETPKVAKVRKPRNGLVRKVRNGGLVKVEQKTEVAKVIEQSVHATLPAPKITDISTRGNLNGQRGFSILR